MDCKPMKINAVLILSCLLFLAGLSSAETLIEEQTITESQYWDFSGSPYRVTGYMKVAAEGALFIEPGVIINFNEDVSLGIYGEFVAEGTETELIIFKWYTEGVHWGGIYFNSPSPTTNILSHCRVVGGRQIKISSNDPTISSCVIAESEEYGIFVETSPRIVNNMIEQNHGTGVYIDAAASGAIPVIENNLILNNEGNGIYVHNLYADPAIRYNTIDSNGLSGLYFNNSTSSTVVENNIVTHNQRGIGKGANAQRHRNNVWGNETNFYSTSMFETEISSDPVYIDSEYHLDINSPSKRASVCGLEIGAYGSDSYCRDLIDIELTSPNASSIYESGDIEKIAWTTTNAQTSDSIVISMKRDSVPLTQTEPDGKNWYRFAQNAVNDGQEYVVIQPGVAAADDWRFYVRHAPSGKYDAADCNFSVIGTSGHNSPTVKAPLDGQYIDPSDGVTLSWYLNNPYGEISDVRLLLEMVSSQGATGGQVIFDEAIDVITNNTFRDLEIDAWHHWRIELQFADGQATSVDSWFKTVAQGEFCPDVAIDGLDRDIHATAGSTVVLSGMITAQSEISVIALFVTKDAYGQIMHVHHAVETPESSTFDLSNFSIPGDELTDIEIYSFHIQIRTANCPEGYNDHGKITVTPGELKILPVIDQAQYRPFTVTVEAKDASGNPLDGNNMTAVVSDTLGYDSNTIYITLRQGTGTGEYVINTPVENVRLTATGYFGSTATSEPFNVEPAESFGCTLQGIVKNDEVAIEGAVVSLYDDYNGQTPVFTSQTTDSNGKYEFDFIPCGKYYGEASHDVWGISSKRKQLILVAERPNKRDIEIESECLFDRIPVLLIPGIMGSTLKNNQFVHPELPLEFAASPPDTNIKIHDPEWAESIIGTMQLDSPVGFTKLKEELRQMGYVEDCTLFEAPWDWRMPIHLATETYLKEWIDYVKI